MSRNAPSSLSEQLAAAHDWWREAGVDHVFADEANTWLEARPQPAAQAAPAASEEPASPPPPAIGGNTEGWPADLAQFAAWWLAEPSLAHGGADLRVLPRGRAGAKLMAVVAEPEREDRERLLSGEHGKLLTNFFAKAGVDESEVYFAAALPRHTPMADWRELRQQGLDRVLLHHIALVRPERLILFGQDVTALLGHDPAQNPHFLLDLNHQGGSIRVLAARSLDHMLRIPSARKRLWQDWLDWTDG